MTLHTDVGYETGLYKVTRRSAGVRVDGHYVRSPDLDRDVTSIDPTPNTFQIVGHGLLSGSGPFWITSSNQLPGGLGPGPVWAIVLDEDIVQLAASVGDALAGVEIDVSDAGVGVVHIGNWFLASADVQPITGDALKDLREGQRVENLRTMFTDTQLLCRTELYEPDTVEIDGQEYRVDKVHHFGVISGHYRVTVERIDSP